jgi:DNA repair protein RadC
MEQMALWNQCQKQGRKTADHLQTIREKMAVYGPNNIDLYELLTVITGTWQEKALLELSALGAREISKMSVAELEGYGLTKASASKLVAAFALAEKLQKDKRPSELFISCPQDAVALVKGEMENLDQEHFKVILLNTKNNVIGISTITIGTLNSCLINPREAYKEALRKNAAGIVAVHNHPSGNPTPSDSDIKMAEKLKKAGNILDIKLLDFIIIGKGNYISFADKGFI